MKHQTRHDMAPRLTPLSLSNIGRIVLWLGYRTNVRARGWNASDGCRGAQVPDASRSPVDGRAGEKRTGLAGREYDISDPNREDAGEI